MVKHRKIYFKDIYTFIFIFWYSTEIIFNTTLKTIFGVLVESLSNIISGIVFCLLLLQIVFFQSYKKKELFIIIVVTLPIVVATVLSEHRILLSAWMFIVACKNNNFERVIRIAYKILLITIPIIFILRWAGFIEDYIMVRGNAIRYSLGFSHPNQLGLRIFQLIACHCFVHRDKLRARNYFIIVLAIFFTIIIPNSQTAYICVIGFFLLLLIYQYISGYQPTFVKLYAQILTIGVLLLNGLSILLSYINVSRNKYLALMDRWMSTRFLQCHRVWSIYGVSFFGQRIYVSEAEWRTIGITRRLWLDNAYAAILLRYGLLVFLIVSAAYLILLKRKVENREYILVIILFLYSLYGVMENGLFALSHNIFLLAFADLLYNKGSREKIRNGGII